MSKPVLQTMLPRAWFALVVGLLIALGWQIPHGIGVETNLLSLLPSFEKDAILKKSVERFTKQVNPRLVFLVGHENPVQAQEAATGLSTALRNSGHFASVEAKFQQDSLAAWHRFYFPHRYRILSPEIQRLLSQPDPVAATLHRLQQQLYAPLPAFSGQMLAQDPLLFFPSFLQHLPKPPGRVTLEDGWLTVRDHGTTFRLVTGMLQHDPFNIGRQGAVQDWMTETLQQVALHTPGTEVLHTGVFRFAATASEEAQREVSTIGLGSVLGILLLIITTFRGGRPLAVVALPLAVGLLAAVTICSALYGKLHLFTLVFGASLVGVSVDYAFHYLAKHRLSATQWDAWSGIWKIFPAITMGVITSILGYTAFSLTPFPALQQIAVFSAVGLLGAYGTVVCWFPLLLKSAPKLSTPPVALVAVRGFVRLWEKLLSQRATPLVLVGVALGSLATFSFLRFDDDIRALEHRSPALQAEDTRIRELIGGLEVSRFIVVRGATVEAVLQRQEEATRRLERLAQTDPDFRFQSLASLLPSQKTLSENQALFQDRLLNPPDSLKQGLLSLGFAPGVVESFIQQLLAPEPPVLAMNKWLASPVSIPFRHLWLGKIEQEHVSLILLGSRHDAQQIAAALAGVPGVTYHNQVERISNLFQQYRETMIQVAVLAYLLVFVFLMGKYRFWKALKIIGSPALATLLTFALFALTDQPVNLLHVVSSFLILGIGVDYTIFFTEGHQAASETGLAVLLSALTTLLSFGLLFLSETPALEAVGLTVMLGIGLALLLSPLALPKASNGQKTES